MGITKKILIFILFAFVAIQVIQAFTGIIKVKPLGGVTVKTEVPALSMTSWLSGAFQDSVNNRLDEIFGFRPLYIRLYNQIDYSLYGVIHGDAVMLGKDNFLFEEWYVMEYRGFYNVGRKKIDEKIRKLNFIYDYLKKHNTNLLVVIAPGKPYYYPEFMPEEPKPVSKYTNYYTYAEVIRNSGLPWIDVNDWFIKAKDTTTYPLFSKTGTHWSEYGATLVADSLLKYTQYHLKKPMNSVYIKELRSKPFIKTTDTDLYDLANLIFPIKELDLKYPRIEIDSVYDRNEAPERIVISDSFFWNLVSLKTKVCYKKTRFWYYYNSIFPQWENHHPTIKDIDVLQKIKETDLVMIMVTTAGLHKFGYGFIEDVYEKIEQENASLLTEESETTLTQNKEI